MLYLLLFMEDIMKTVCSIYRGGTSKAIFFNESDLPENKSKWSEFLLDIMGSPDKRQIDGLGGANSLTSKVAIIKKSYNPEYDVEYTFAQISIENSHVDYSNNCGNISSAVGPYAVDNQLVEIHEGLNIVKILNTNTKKLIISELIVENGRTKYSGDFQIPGVPGSSSKIKLSFYKPQGSVTKKLVPTDNPVDYINSNEQIIPISIIDAANPLVFVNASDVGLAGNEMPEDFSQLKLDELEIIRGKAAELLGFCNYYESSIKSPAIPKLTIISKSTDSSDITVRMMSMQKPHKAVAITGAICITAASQVNGSLVNKIIKPYNNTIQINSPSGIVSTEFELDENGLKSVSVFRTARLLMEGTVYSKEEY